MIVISLFFFLSSLLSIMNFYDNFVLVVCHCSVLSNFFYIQIIDILENCWLNNYHCLYVESYVGNLIIITVIWKIIYHLFSNMIFASPYLWMKTEIFLLFIILKRQGQYSKAKWKSHLFWIDWLEKFLFKKKISPIQRLSMTIDGNIFFFLLSIIFTLEIGFFFCSRQNQNWIRIFF